MLNYGFISDTGEKKAPSVALWFGICSLLLKVVCLLSPLYCFLSIAPPSSNNFPASFSCVRDQLHPSCVFSPSIAFLLFSLYFAVSLLFCFLFFFLLPPPSSPPFLPYPPCPLLTFHINWMPSLCFREYSERKSRLQVEGYSAWASVTQLAEKTSYSHTHTPSLY